MRATLLGSLVTLCATSLHSQDFATVYVTPPTSGCNGVWAVQVTSLYCTPASPYTFVMEPSGCLQLSGWTSDMGTMLIPLCAVPCSLEVTTADSVTCSGSTADAPIGINEHGAPGLTVRNDGRTIELVSTITLPRIVVHVLDVNGRFVSNATLYGGKRWRIQAPDTPGPYMLRVEGAGFLTCERFVVTD